jgi:hypothetical protein
VVPNSDKTLLAPAEAPLPTSADELKSYLDLQRAEQAANAEMLLNQEPAEYKHQQALLATKIKVLEMRLKDRRKQRANNDRATPLVEQDSSTPIEDQWQAARAAERVAKMQLDTARLQASTLQLQKEADKLRKRLQPLPVDPLAPVPLIAGGNKPTSPPVLPNGDGPQPIGPPTTLPWFPPPHPVKWEYKVMITSAPLQEHELNRYGADRWELVQVLTMEDVAFHTMFKRPKQ